jgi:hypothetical protein
VVGACECSNERSASIKGGEVPDELRACQLLRKDCAPCSYGG